MEKFNTVDELWIEFEKCIKYGGFKKFKTKKGMIGYIKKLRPKFGKSYSFKFNTENGYKEIKISIDQDFTEDANK